MRASKPPVKLDGVHILLVDDNQFGLTARKLVLEELGCKLTALSCPKQALAEFQATHYHLVVTDYNMPQMKGNDLIARLRELRPDIPVILISGMADTLGLTEQNTGANAVIQKSANEVAVLKREVHRVLQQPKQRRKPPQSQRSESKKRKDSLQ